MKPARALCPRAATSIGGFSGGGGGGGGRLGLLGVGGGKFGFL